MRAKLLVGALLLLGFMLSVLLLKSVQSASSMRVLELRDINLLQGQAPRRFV